MAETRIKRWLSRLPWPLLTLVCLGIVAGLFGIGAGFWYVAHGFAWWTFALFYTGVTLFNPVVNSLWKGGRK